MGWDAPSLPSVDATCDRCGRCDYFEADSSTSGHWEYPQPEDVGWGYADDGLLCPDCLGGNEE